MGRKKITNNQKQYRKRKRSRAIGMKTFRIEASMKDHLTQLTIDRVQTQGEIISDLILRCLSYAVNNGQHQGRKAKRKDRSVDTVMISVVLSASAASTLDAYCEMTGNGKSATVNRLIKVASLDPVLDAAAARALFSRKERDETYVQTLKEAWMTPQQRELKRLEEEISRELDEEYGAL